MPDKVSCTLLCPNQICSNGLIVDDVPVHLAPHNYQSKHAIYNQDDESIQILLQLKGCISYFDSRTPVQSELETCQWIHLTYEHHWEPHSDFFQKTEDKALQCLENDTPMDRNLFVLQRSSRNVIDDDLVQLSSAFSKMGIWLRNCKEYNKSYHTERNMKHLIPN